MPAEIVIFGFASEYTEARARLGSAPTDGYDAKLNELLDRVRDDDEARQEYVDLLEVMGADDPRTAGYRKALTARLF